MGNITEKITVKNTTLEYRGVIVPYKNGAVFIEKNRDRFEDQEFDEMPTTALILTEHCFRTDLRAELIAAHKAACEVLSITFT